MIESMSLDAHVVSGLRHSMSDRADLALRDFDEVLKVEPGNKEALLGHGLARTSLGNYKEGINDAEEGLKGSPDDPRACWRAARVYAEAVAQVDLENRERPDRMLLDLRFQYQERSLALLRKCLEEMPAENRKAFLATAIKDYFRPIQQSQGFVKLIKEFRK